MKKFILTEEQVKRVVDSLINEQQVSEFKGGTDAQRITHALLSKNFGLPDGANHENYYYGANIVDVIAMSKTGDRTKFLSSFKPANKYSEDSKVYLDSIYVNNDSLQNSGSKTFKFVNGNVYGTHNGLLALARAMDHMGGRGGFLTISFGSNVVGKDAQSERIGGGVKFDSNRALNQTPVMNLLENALVTLAVAPNFRNLGTFAGIKKDWTNDELITIIQKLLNNIIIGVYGFMDNEKKDDIIQNLTSKGFVDNFNFNITGNLQKLISLQQIPDKIRNEDSEKVVYNGQKQNQLNGIGDSFEENMINQLKKLYSQNFKIYVDNYLPNSSSQMSQFINNVRFDYKGLGDCHEFNFNSYVAGSSTNSSTLKQSNTNYKTGN